jgi:hypothetical protein
LAALKGFNAAYLFLLVFVSLDARVTISGARVLSPMNRLQKVKALGTSDMTYMYIAKWEPELEDSTRGSAIILASTLGTEKPHVGTKFRFNLLLFYL